MATAGSPARRCDGPVESAGGDLDVFVADLSDLDRLYRDDLASGAATLADLDQDGDFDAMAADGSGDRRNVYNENVPGGVDVHAPRVPALEPLSDGPTGPNPIAVRAHVLDNQPDHLTRFNATTLEHRVDGGAWIGSPMSHSDSQVFRGERPPNLSG